MTKLSAGWFLATDDDQAITWEQLRDKYSLAAVRLAAEIVGYRPDRRFIKDYQTATGPVFLPPTVSREYLSALRTLTRNYDESN